ncbi:hypothetical protein [Microvirga aerophila]|uniref:tRNA-binding domain-containing protein n=1 Tax=Microvirga aerophila TaxID=670291 RepID=A0A512C285_9HYPH|nr:hypothetical protein [Microvirga aerophila]GEO18332.1 hypothetical protein MAE02_60280 [Microvirga aerophila]
MEITLINYDDFAKVDIHIGQVKSVLPFERERNPSHKVDFSSLGTKCLARISSVTGRRNS